MKVAAITHWSGADVNAALALAVGTPPRRAGRFAELALLGAMQCAAALELPTDTMVILATRYGNRRVASELARTVAVERSAPMPFAFISSQNGAACQLIARHLGLNGTALCLSSSHALLERALALTATLLEQDGGRTALVGWVDQDHADGATNAVSHWLCLDARVQARGADIAVLTEADAAQAKAWVASAGGDVVFDFDPGVAATLDMDNGDADDAAMARHVESWWRDGGTYLRVRAVEDDRYVVLRLRR
ncbi:MAG: hypothetical protein WA373_14300 [Burkholderiales bacterium]